VWKKDSSTQVEGNWSSNTTYLAAFERLRMYRLCLQVEYNMQNEDGQYCTISINSTVTHNGQFFLLRI
jgi:hypothetical protein